MKRHLFLHLIICVGLSLPISAIDTSIKPVIPALPEIVEREDSIENEIKTLDNLIEISQKNLENQRALKSMIVDYKKIQEQFLRNDQDKELMFRMVRQAHRVLETIKENHLTHLFRKEFLSELTLFSQIAVKKGIPKP